MMAAKTGKGYEVRPNGTFRVVRRVNGKKSYRTFDDERDAIMAAGEAPAARSGVPGFTLIKPPSFTKVTARHTPTVVDYATEIIEGDDLLRPNTRRTYATALRRIEADPIGDLELHAVTASDVRSLFRSLDANRENVRHVLAKVFGAAVREGIIAVSPFTQANVAAPKRKPKRLRILTADEVESLVRAAPTERDRLAIRLGAYCGLRGGEVGGLRVEDIDFEGCRINVNRNAVQAEGGIIFGDPKTETSIRSLKVDCSTTDDIAALIASDPPLADGTILHTSHGNPVTAQQLTYVTVQASAKAGLRRTTFHDLRHTAASLLIAAGLEPKAIQAYLGHASITMTFDIYGELFPKADDPLAEAMGALRASAERKALPSGEAAS